tara:strand:+ start:25 stop:246 length:222 start_codon:yes stop_codon:yes gene_type:complete
MPNNMRIAGKKYGNGGSKKKMQDGGMFDTGTPSEDNMMMRNGGNPGRERMEAYANGGGLMGYTKGGDVMDVYK